MPAYKYFTKDGKTKWYANFYYEDWLGKRQHKCKRGFSTKKEAVEWERDFLAQGAKDPDILFSALIKNYMQDCSSRLKLTTLENKQYLIDMKLLPFFKDMKIGDITPIVIHRWQDAMINYRDEKGNPYSQTYLKTINNQLSAIMNYAVKYYKLRSNPCLAAGAIGKSSADEMNIWTREQFDYFLTFEKKSAYRMAFSLMFYGGLRSAEVLAITPADILPDCSVSINKNFVVIKGEQYFQTPKTETFLNHCTKSFRTMLPVWPLNLMNVSSTSRSPECGQSLNGQLPDLVFRKSESTISATPMQVC